MIGYTLNTIHRCVLLCERYISSERHLRNRLLTWTGPIIPLRVFVTRPSCQTVNLGYMRLQTYIAWSPQSSTLWAIECSHSHHHHIRGHSRKLLAMFMSESQCEHSSVKDVTVHTPFPMRTCARCPISISTACATCFCSQFKTRSRLLDTCCHSPLRNNAIFSSRTNSGSPSVMIYIFFKPFPASVFRTLRTLVRIRAMDGEQRAWPSPPCKGGTPCGGG